MKHLLLRTLILLHLFNLFFLILFFIILFIHEFLQLVIEILLIRFPELLELLYHSGIAQAALLVIPL